MENKFWIEEKKLKQLYEEYILADNPKATFWDIFSDYTPVYNEPNEIINGIEVDNFQFPELELAISDTTIGLGDMRGFIEQENRVENRFQDYRKEISELLNVAPDLSLLPSTQNSHFKEEDWNTIKNFRKYNPFTKLFLRGQISIWRNEEKLIFLTIIKGLKRQPYIIKIVGLNYEKYKSILDEWNKIYELK